LLHHGTDLRKFFRDKRVLVTGHTGFKGSWLSQVLLLWGANVCGYGLAPNTQPNLFNVLGLKKNLEHNLSDIRDQTAVNKIIKRFRPEIVFHLAAQPLVRDSYKNPEYTYAVNIMGTVNILEAVRESRVKSCIIVTSDKVYKNLEQDVAYEEDSPLGGYDPYSNSKACADLIVSSYIQSFFLPENFGKQHNTLIASVRSGNVIGGGDWNKDRLFPDLVKAFLEHGRDVVIRNPDSTRPWQYVLDTLYGYLLLAKSLYSGEVDKSGSWNFGPWTKNVLSVSEIVKVAIDHLEKGSVTIKRDDSKHEAKLLKLNINKARKQLFWQPKFDVYTAIEETMLWYKLYYSDQGNSLVFTKEQIKRYFEDTL